ncbi:hypothetical protein [Natronorubrum daqingense]|uniref:Uncharacterized protein n=1 Tax=Natronorubrum daqingense TaxID=588898 RepID=A0A1N7CUM5_9EURY|nr:hypothetical protein [Natronorubrum daqingense]APX97066.1 hypothetical protein BB347_10775 [Natronorubrum daqingense]SIR67273.1 hypothetical protein SAMN05421809_1889 [Natronorubrum daqingense]
MKERIFREPDGWTTGGVWIAIGLFFLALYAYYHLVGLESVSAALYFGILWILMGIPELLPKEQERTAAGLRIIGLVYTAALLVFYLSRLPIFQ